MGARDPVNPVLASAFSDAFDFIFHERESVAGTVRIGGLGEIGRLVLTHLELSFAAVAIAMLVSIPIGLVLGHLGKAQFLAVSVSNVGRAVPAIALIAFFIAFFGVGFTNVCLALILLAIPPILTNTYVGVRGVSRTTLDAATAMGLSHWQIIRGVELPLAMPTIWTGVRISLVSVVATATIAPYASVNTLGLPIINEQIYGDPGRLGACIVIALLTLGLDGLAVALERVVIPRGVRVSRRRTSATRPLMRRPSILARSPETT
jgi:osmoprotectant transport system permease protein